MPRVTLGIPPDHSSPFDDTPSYEELTEIVAALQLLSEHREERIVELEDLNRSLVARIADLEERLGRNPRNSAMPPSAELFSKPPVPNRAERRAAKRRPGKQPGTEGKHLAQVEDPDDIQIHAPTACRGCGGNLDDADVVGMERRQVFELPPIRPFVTEHRMERRRCTCGCETKALPPVEAIAPACYGPGVRALAAYLAVYQHLPYDRMAQLFHDVLGIDVSVGALTQMVAEAGGGFTTNLLFDAGSGTIAEPMSVLVKESLGAIGINVEIQKIPGANFRGELMKKTAPMVINRFGGWLDWPDYFFFWNLHSSNAIFNTSNYQNKDMDHLIDGARFTQDAAEYARDVQGFLAKAMDEVPFIPVCQPLHDVAMQKGIGGYQFWPCREPDFRSLTKA